MAKTPLVNGKTFAQASAGITDRNALGALARQYQNIPAPTVPTPTANKNTPIFQLSTAGIQNNNNSQYQDILDKQARGEDIVNTGKIRSDILAQFQDRINATNQIYDQQLAQSRLEGQGRVGSGTALLAARGLAGSGRGSAIQSNIVSENERADAAVNAERNLAIQNIMGLASQAAVEEAARRREAITSGAKGYIDFIKSQGEIKKSNLDNVTAQLISQGIDPSTMDAQEIDSIAKQLGVSSSDIFSTYKQAKYLQDKQDEEAAQKGGFELSEGQARYDSRGNLIASRAKTYAPKSGSGTVSGSGTGTRSLDSFTPQTLALARQIQSGSATLQSVPSAQRGEVALAMQSLGLSPGKEVEVESNIQIVDSLLNNKKLSRIFGPIDQLNAGKVSGVLSSGEARLAKNQYDQLKGILSLENRQKLKGSGAISDFEFKVLSDAATALGRNLNTNDAKNLLLKIKQTFQSAADRANEFKSAETQVDTFIAPDGTEVQIID